MKIRTNFVSNSSSSSFVLFTDMTKEEFLEIWSRLIINLSNWNSNVSIYKDIESYATIDCLGDELIISTIYDNSIPSDVKSLLEIMGFVYED